MTPSGNPIAFTHPLRLLLTVEEAAHALGISRAHAYRLIMRDEIPSLTIGRVRRVPLAALHSYVERRLAEEHSA